MGRCNCRRRGDVTVAQQSGFKEGAGRKAAAPGFLNKHLSGSSAWHANPKKQAKATELSQQLLEKLKQDRESRACKKT